MDNGNSDSELRGGLARVEAHYATFSDTALTVAALAIEREMRRRELSKLTNLFDLELPERATETWDARRSAEAAE